MNMENRVTPLQEVVELRSADRLQEHGLDTRPQSTRDEFWRRLKEASLPWKTRAAHGILAAEKFFASTAAFDLARTKLMQIMKSNGWRSIAITSPTPQCGKSFVALNLAFSLANLDETRTVLMDMDLKDPDLAEMLEMKDPGSMEAFLKGDVRGEELLRRYEKNLAIGANRQPVRLSAELLQSAAASQALAAMTHEANPDIVIYDMTSLLLGDDVMAFLPNVDCSILVAAAEQSTVAELDACERQLAQITNFAGVILNKCRYTAAW